MSRIVQCANFVAPGSGGLKTTLRHLAAGYAAAGHEVVQVIPGPRDLTTTHDWGRLVEVRSPQLPGTGYRLITEVWRLPSLLEELAPDRLEVHDRLTLRWLGRWAHRHGVPALVVSHERLDQVLAQWLPRRLHLDTAADRSNRALASSFDAVVCTTSWAAEEFERLDTRAPVLIPLGVDLSMFRPAPALERARPLLMCCTRLSREKNPVLAIETLRSLVSRGVDAELVIAGDGPLRGSLEAAAGGLPVTLLGYVSDRSRLASLLAGADVVISPGPVETFGLAALEALASGTPVVGNAASALGEVIGTGGLAMPGNAEDFADGVSQLLSLGQLGRTAARLRAEEFPWAATVEGFLDVHRLGPPQRRAVAA